MDMKHILKWHGMRNIPLNYDEAYALGKTLVTTCRPGAENKMLQQVQTLAVLTSLHAHATYAWRNESSDECECRLPEDASEMIAGICAAVFDYDIACSEAGFLEVHAMDNCGMGGDLTLTANVSTLAGLIAANGGVRVCKHGSPANADAGRHGSSDFVHLLGLPTKLPKRCVENMVNKKGFGYTEALDVRYKHIHHQTHEFAQLPHMNDLIGPVTNPVHPHMLTHRVIGVNHLIDPLTVARAYKLLNDRGVTRMKHLLCVRGFIEGERRGGVDELSICRGGTHVAELRDGIIRCFRLDAAAFGVEMIDGKSISPPEGQSKGEFSLRILHGHENGGARSMVLANAALLFYLDCRGDFSACYRLAEESIASLPEFVESLKR